MTVRDLLANIGSDEFTEWMAFERIEPFGAMADEFRLGAIAAATFNAQRTSEKDPYLTPDQFMPTLANAKRRHAKAPAVDNLTDDQHAALFDACVFGMTQQ